MTELTNNIQYSYDDLYNILNSFWLFEIYIIYIIFFLYKPFRTYSTIILFIESINKLISENNLIADSYHPIRICYFYFYFY